MKNLAFIFCIIFAQFSCSKDNKISNSNGEYHELKNGDSCIVYKYAFSPRINNIQIISNNFFKITNNFFKIYNQYYSIDTIQTFLGTDKVFISPYSYGGYRDSFTTLHVRNAKSLTNDSIVGEYYNAWSYNSPQRVYVPDSGIFVIKIK